MPPHKPGRFSYAAFFRVSPQVWFSGLEQPVLFALRRELLAVVPFSVVMAVASVQFCSFVARKALQMPDSLLAILMACHMLGLLLAGPLVALLQTRQKITLLSRLVLAVSILLLAVQLIPTDGVTAPWAAYVFLLQVFLVQVGLALIIILRTGIWRKNYPKEHRGKLVVVVVLCTMMISSGAILLFCYAMDHWLVSFQTIYFVSGLFGLAAAGLFLRVRILGEDALGQQKKEHGREASGFLAGLAVLKRDRAFRIFMIWQMFNGFATLVVEIVLVVILADVFQSNWVEGGAALAVIPLASTGLAGVIWARFFDRTNIYKIRCASAVCWALARFTLLIGVWQMSLAVVLASRVVSGIAMGGGQLAWRLGHMEFGTEEEDSLYMGAHVGLTGIRGILAPFCGIYLYHLFGALWLFGISGVCLVISAVGFLFIRHFIGNHRPTASVDMSS